MAALAVSVSGRQNAAVEADVDVEVSALIATRTTATAEDWKRVVAAVVRRIRIEQSTGTRTVRQQLESFESVLSRLRGGALVPGKRSFLPLSLQFVRAQLLVANGDVKAAFECLANDCVECAVSLDAQSDDAAHFFGTDNVAEQRNALLATVRLMQQLRNPKESPLADVIKMHAPLIAEHWGTAFLQQLTEIAHQSEVAEERSIVFVPRSKSSSSQRSAASPTTTVSAASTSTATSPKGITADQKAVVPSAPASSSLISRVLEVLRVPSSLARRGLVTFAVVAIVATIVVLLLRRRLLASGGAIASRGSAAAAKRALTL